MTVKIDQAFINTFIDGSFDLPIAHENIQYNPTAGTEYAELINLPNDVTPMSMNDSNETDGLLRVILYYPVNIGSIVPKLKADEILSVFKIGTQVCYELQCATVVNVARAKGLSIDGWYRIIISISYRAFIAR